MGKESLGSGGRGAAPGAIGYLVVSTGNGNEIFYANSRVKVLLGHRVGQVVTVWWQPGFRFRPLKGKVGVTKQASEILVRDANWYVLKYRKSRPSQIEFDSRDHLWYGAMLVLGLFLLVRPAWKHLKKSDAEADGVAG